MTTLKDSKIRELEKRIKHLERQKSAGITKYDVFRFLCFLGSGIMAYLSCLFLMFTWDFLRIGEFVPYNLAEPQHLLVLFPVLLIYLFIILAVISLVALHKRGFRNLNSFDEEGLIHGLIYGLIAGLIIALVAGLIYGLIYGLIAGLIFGLIGGLICEYT